MVTKRQNRRKRQKSSSPFVFFPNDSGDMPYIMKLSCQRSIPRNLSKEALRHFFSRYGIARIYDLNEQLQIEIWIGSRRVRHGTQSDISAFMRNYYERKNVVPDADLTDQQMFLGYLTELFSSFVSEVIQGSVARFGTGN